MPYVERDEKGKIVAVYSTPRENATEEVTATHPAIVEFMFGRDAVTDEEASNSGYFQDLYELRLSDLALIRVLEDVIYLLLEKNILHITEFPVQAIRRLQQRERIRKKLRQIGGSLANNLDGHKGANGGNINLDSLKK